CERHRCWPYRVGGDEFAIPLPGGDEAAGAELAEIVRASVAIRPIAGLPITVSVGVAASPAGWGWDDPTLPVRATAALQHAKRAGRNAAFAEHTGLVTPPEERRGTRLLAPCRAVVAEPEPWWSFLLVWREQEPAHPVLSLPDPASVTPAHRVVDDGTPALSEEALTWHGTELAARTARSGAPVALVVADLDGFTALNERWGARAGDDVLREIAHRIETSAPALVAPYRTGGDAFAIVLVGADARRAFAVAERLRGAVASASAGALQLSVSVGVASSGPAGFDLAETTARANAALATARAGGGDQVRLDGVAAPTPDPAAPRTLRAA
ncbi:MAG: diguanylate cyclase, partial [Solirubrobacteraceae bacterium]|nr:diguanylate cyclase [Solirubrobacteraceae bacterium]